MGRKRRHLFVLLFVLGLVILSGIVIATKPTKIGLDLKGGLELVYEGTPTGQVKEVSGEDIERATIALFMLVAVCTYLLFKTTARRFYYGGA